MKQEGLSWDKDSRYVVVARDAAPTHNTARAKTRLRSGPVGVPCMVIGVATMWSTVRAARWLLRDGKKGQNNPYAVPFGGKVRLDFTIGRKKDVQTTSNACVDVLERRERKEISEVRCRCFLTFSTKRCLVAHPPTVG